MADAPDGQAVVYGSSGSVAEPRRTPALSRLLGYGAMASFAVGAVAAWLLDARWAALASAALAVPWTAAALALLLVGYLSLGVLDPWAASGGEAPPFFARRRPVQMPIPVASLAALLVHVLAGR